MTYDIQIFRAGRQTDNSGRTINFSRQQLAATCAAYNAAKSKHLAPLVIGHPKTDDPAYGWVDKLRLDGDTVVAEVGQVDAQFAALHRAGRYKTVSASFYAPKAPDNPAPGVYALRHVGFLGAVPPAVRGLKPVQFSAKATGVVTINFSEAAEAAAGQGLGMVGAMFRRLREWIIETHGSEVADRVIPDFHVADVQAVAAEIVDEAADDPLLDTATADDLKAAVEDAIDAAADQVVEETEAAVTELEARVAELEAKEAEFAARQRHARKRDNAEFVSGLVNSGKLAPGLKNQILDFMETLDDTSRLNFSGGKERQSSLDFFKDFMGRQNKVIEFAEFSADDGGTGVLDAKTLAQRAVEYRAAEATKGNIIDVATAVRAVEKRFKA